MSHGLFLLIPALIMMLTQGAVAQTTATTTTVAPVTTTVVQPLPVLQVPVPVIEDPTKKSKIDPLAMMSLMATTMSMSRKKSPMNPREAISHVNDGNRAVQRVRSLNAGPENCDEKSVRNGDLRSKFENADVSKSDVAPLKDENSLNNQHPICGTRPGNYDICIPKDSSIPVKFKFSNRSLDRDWSFEFEDRARQDLGISINDGMGGSVSRSKDTYMMVFPRNYLPSTRIEGSRQIVTLANGETVTYDVSSKKILSGVLNDSKVYSGNGVAIRTDQTGNDARFASGASATATITKQGKTCKVPKKSLWPDQSSQSNLHFKFATDEVFDSFIRQKCGFGIN